MSAIKNVNAASKMVLTNLENAPLETTIPQTPPTTTTPALSKEIDYTFYAAHTDPQNSHSLMKPVLDRFSQTAPFPAFNPASNYDYMTTQTVKGSLFFASQLLHLDEALRDMMFAAATRRDEEFRVSLRKDAEHYDQEKFSLEQFEIARRRVQALLHQRIEKALVRQEENRVLSSELVEKQHAIMELRLELYDTETKEQREAYLQAVEKAKEKRPYDLATSGDNIAALFSAMREEVNPSRILAVLSQVEKNLLIKHALKIIEHINGDSMPSPVFNRLASNLNRRQIREDAIFELRDDSRLERLAETFQLREEKWKLAHQERLEQIASIEKNISDYWDVYDLNHEVLRLNMTLGSHSLTDMMRRFNWQDISTLLQVKDLIQENIDHSHADQLLEHVQSLPPGLLSALHNHFVYSDHLEERYIQEQIANHQRREQEADLLLWQRLDMSRQKAIEIKVALTERIRQHWQEFDDKNQPILLSMSHISTNLNDVQRLSNYMDPVKVRYFLKNAIISDAYKYRMQLNEHAQGHVTGLLSYENIKYRRKDELIISVPEHEQEIRDKTQKEHELIKIERKASEIYQQEEHHKNNVDLKLSIPLSSTSPQTIKSKLRFLPETIGATLQEATEDNIVRSKASLIAEHSSTLNDPNIRNFVDPSSTVTESIDTEVIRKPGKTTRVYYKYSDSNLLPDTVQQIGPSQQIAPKEEPVASKSDLQNSAADKKSTAIIDTYHRQEQSIADHMTPNLIGQLSGLEESPTSNSGPEIRLEETSQQHLEKLSSDGKK